MNTIKNHTKEFVVLTILLALAVSVVNAAVFVYYPMSITAGWVAPPVSFASGSNAGKDDLSGTITVNIGNDGASVDITVHPCRRQTTYYKNITLIVNGDSKAYYYGFNVSQAFTSPIDEAKLIIRHFTTGNKIGEVDLKATASTWSGWQLSASEKVRIDLKLKIDASNTDSQTAQLQLVYSPQNESPP